MEGYCNGYFTSNCGNTMDQSDPFESALSSIVSSPAASNGGAEEDNTMINELIGRLGNICNSGQISPSQSFLGGNSNNNSTNTTCYNTPLNSPSELTLMNQQIMGGLPLHPGFAPIATDPGFAERAARLSCFGSSSFSGLNGNLGLNFSELPLRSSLASRSSSNLVSSSKFSRMSRPCTPENAEAGDSREGSSVSDQIPHGEMATKGQSDVNSRKRKAVSKNKGVANDAGVAAENDEQNEKKIKPSNISGTEKDAGIVQNEEDESTKRSGGGNQKQNKDNSKPAEPPKDYIHVRARRGQATDSHSLAERLRREKISQRMKALQDLVPGCNKVTGKAVMLDEIINYVQSLQRQVEFLSMKLTTINPSMDVNLEAFLLKDQIFRGQGSMPNSVLVSDPSLPFAYQQGLHLHNGISNNVEAQFLIPSLNPEVQRNPNMPFSHTSGFGEASHQVSNFSEDDLQNVVQMGLVQNPEILNGSLAPPQMKFEL